MKSIATLLCILIFAGVAPAGQAQRYVYNGESLTPRPPNRPLMNCDRWEIWFYTARRAAQRPYPLPGQPGYRGAIWGKTPSDIQNLVERIQKFQRAYEKVTGLTKHDDGWDHTLGPICAAIPRFHPDSVVLRGLRQADNNQIQITRAWINLGDAFMHAEPVPSGERPEFRDAMEKLSKAFEINSNLLNLLTRLDAPPIAEIRDAIYEATDAVQKAQLGAGNIHALLVGPGKNRK